MNKLMRYFCMAAMLFSFTGCNPSQEDRDFFYSGWVNPEEGANMRMYGTKKAPAEYGGHATTPTDFPSTPLP